MDFFTSTSLPKAVAQLFEMNNYDVVGPVSFHGAEIDLVATPRGDPFATKVYIEVTVEYVDNEKYSKDLTKLALVAAKEPQSRRLIVSSSGFSIRVVERASETAVETLTYDELMRRFERFAQYLDRVVGTSENPSKLASFALEYEEPEFDDAVGRDDALSWLEDWRDGESSPKWLIITGEYGTGKTALTEVLQYNWSFSHMENPSLPIPFRIELREFNRQFDARGLLHHFLDTNSIGHVPVDFVFSLVRQGRIVLLLDGYDEMAQYLNIRERRACLEALASLAADGARGILTSRPNYFSDAEEYRVLDALYRSLQSGRMYLTNADKDLIDQEKAVDDLIERQFLERFERALRDLSPEQTQELVRRRLANDPAGREAVLAILRKVFRTVEEGTAVSLSGKPVIISYLLQIVDDLKDRSGEEASRASLSEWGVYELIIDQLMVRDWRQAGETMPVRRRAFLQTLALSLSHRDRPSIDEQEFRELVRKNFRDELRYFRGEDLSREVENRFEDLRRSGTLTRGTSGGANGWRFSHNSLREFLLCELVVSSLEAGEIVNETYPVSSAMRSFVASLDDGKIAALLTQLSTQWGNRSKNPGIGGILSLLWDGLMRRFAVSSDPTLEVINQLSGDQVLSLNDITISQLVLSSNTKASQLKGVNFSGVTMTDVVFAAANCSGCRFDDSILDSVSFADANLSGSSFDGAILEDVDLTGATLINADFSGIDSASSILIRPDYSLFPDRLVGREANGYLKFFGATAGDCTDFQIYRNHPKFSIFDKIMSKLAERALRQRRGLVQRGVASRDMRFSEACVRALERNGVVNSAHGRSDIVTLSSEGREVVSNYVERAEIPTFIVTLLDETR